MRHSVFADPECYPAVSLHQPYAGLVRLELKPIETRKTRIHYRGPLVICATQSIDGDAYLRLFRELVPGRVSGDAFQAACEIRGALCALVEVVGCRELTPEDEPRSLFYAEGRFAWELERIRPLKPLPVRGSQGFFRVPRALVDGALGGGA